MPVFIERKVILVADDDSSIIESYTRVLKSSRISVETAHNGEMAIERIRLNPIDFVILDMDLPFMDGIETLMEIRRIKPDLPVVIVTGDDSKEVRWRALEAGATNFATKPLDLGLLRRLINKWLDIF